MTKILIAEDERDIRDLVVFTLQFGGYEVVATGNGAELVSAAPTEKPDLILSDVRMPKMTGYEACQALKANPDTKDIPIVFLSAKGQEEEVSRGMDAGATAYILKPFAPDVLLARVKEILAEYGGKPKAAAPAAAAAPAPSSPAPSAPAGTSTPAPVPSSPVSAPAGASTPPTPATPAPSAPSTPAPATPPAAPAVTSTPSAPASTTPAAPSPSPAAPAGSPTPSTPAPSTPPAADPPKSS